MAMADSDLPFPLFTCCKFTINDKIPNKDGKLFKLFTNTLNFKISSIDPLVIEKDWPSQEDITELVEALKGLLLLDSINCVSEDNQGETSELRRTKENIQSDKQVHSQDVRRIKENCGILRTNTGTDMSHAKNASEMQPVVSENANISKEMKMQKHVDGKNEKHGASKSSSVVGDRPWFGNIVASSSDLRTERNSVYQIGKFTLHTDTRPAFNHSADITITVGKPFDKLSGLHDFSVSSNMKDKEGLKNTFKVFSLSKPNGQQEKLVCALLPKPDNANAIKEAIGNLSTIIQSPNKKIFMQNIRKVVLTSSILYDEPYNTQKKGEKHTFDRKKVGDIARCLFDYLDQASRITASSISIILVGNEKALQSIHKVLESRGVKKISPKVHQGARSNARDSSPYRQYGNSGQHPGYAAQDTDYTKQLGEEVNQGARSNARDSSPYHHYGNSGQHPGYAAQGTDYPKQHREEDVGSAVDSEKACEICTETTSIYPVRCCGKYLCQTCKQRMSICPFCRTFLRALNGDQPLSSMTVYPIDDYADGYESTRVWGIKYSFPSGPQKEYHPNPGKTYTGMSRKAFLPTNEDYRLKRLRLAFL